MRGIAAQTRLEVALTFRRGESLLITMGFPVGILAFFSVVDVLPLPGRPVDFLAPGVLALSVISSSMTSLGISTGFERQNGVLRRLATTPLGRGGLLTAKIVALLGVIAVQSAVVVGVAFGLGWRPGAGWPQTIGVLAIGTTAFAGLGFLLAGRLRAETNIAVANALFLVFLLLGGIVVPLGRLPDRVAAIARVLPAEPLASTVRSTLTSGGAVDAGALVTLVVWAAAACALAVRLFRWD